jgi:hypothetical protein
VDQPQEQLPPFFPTGRFFQYKGQRHPVPNPVEFLMSREWCGIATLSLYQRTLVAVSYGSTLTGPLTPEMRAVAEACSGLREFRPDGYQEIVLKAGVRSGKDMVASALSLWEGIFGMHAEVAAVGEVPVIVCVAQDRAAAVHVFLNYVKGYIRHSALLADQVAKVRRDSVELKSGVHVRAYPSTDSAMLGISSPMIVLDEIAAWPSDPGLQNNDVAIYRALRSRQGSFRSATRAFILSTPRGQAGVLYDAFRDFGRQDPNSRTLLWSSSTAEMNPIFSRDLLAREQKRDPHGFSQYYEATFGISERSFLDAVWIANAVREFDQLVYEPASGRTWGAACDWSGGSERGDSTAMAVGFREHVDGLDRIVVAKVQVWDLARGENWNPETIAEQMTAILKSYGLRNIWGDRYAAGFIRSAFERRGITYSNPVKRTLKGATDGWQQGKYLDEPLDRSALYLTALPFFASGQIVIPNNVRLLKELGDLERKTTGKETVDHPAGQHDDVANAVCACIAKLSFAVVEPQAGRIGSAIAERLGYAHDNQAYPWAGTRRNPRHRHCQSCQHFHEEFAAACASEFRDPNSDQMVPVCADCVYPYCSACRHRHKRPEKPGQPCGAARSDQTAVCPQCRRGPNDPPRPRQKLRPPPVAGIVGAPIFGIPGRLHGVHRGLVKPVPTPQQRTPFNFNNQGGQ